MDDQTNPNRDETQAIPSDETQTILTREHLETSKQRARVFREWVYFGIAILIGCVVIVALWSWKKGNDMAGATNARLIAILDKFDAKLDKIDPLLDGGNQALLELKDRIHDLRPVETELAGFLSDMRGEAKTTFSGINDRLKTLDTVLVSVRGDTDKVGTLIADSNTSLNAKPIPFLTKGGLLPSLTALFNNADTRISKLGADGALLLETINSKSRNILDHADAVIVSADGTIKAYEPVGVKLTSILGHVDNIAKESDEKFQSLMHPKPAKGFWPRTKQVVGYVLRPVFDGANMYYTIQRLFQSFPVRLTQPVLVAPKP